MLCWTTEFDVARKKCKFWSLIRSVFCIVVQDLYWYAFYLVEQKFVLLYIILSLFRRFACKLGLVSLGLFHFSLILLKAVLSSSCSAKQSIMNRIGFQKQKWEIQT